MRVPTGSRLNRKLAVASCRLIPLQHADMPAQHTSHPAPPTGGFLLSVLDPDNLFAAWEKVRGNAGIAGVDGQGVDEFGHNVFARLLTLKHQVERDEYRPQPLRVLSMPKPDGSQRRLAVPAVRDRVLQTAAARVLGPVLDKHLEDASYAYRAGRSVPMAVARVAHHRDQGYQWVVDADIETFFDQIDHDLLLAKLRRTLDDHSLLPLIQLWLAATLVEPGSSQPRLLTRGVPQGSPISPLLSNLYLDDFDEALLERDLRLVRFADDFLILCRDRQAAGQALELTGEVVDALRLRLKPEKTRITHFDEGFSFLGVDFIRNLMRPADPAAAPWVMPQARHFAALPAASTAPADQAPPDLVAADASELRGDVETWESARQPLETLPGLDAPDAAVQVDENPALEPILRSLVVLEQGLTLLKESERILIARGREPLASIPLNKLDQVIVHGNHLVSTALFRHAQRTGLQIAFAEVAGRPLGRFDGRRQPVLELQRRQFAREGESDFALMLARAFVGGKIHNGRLLLRRHNRRRQLAGLHDAETAMAELEFKLSTTTGVESVRGIEGAAARHYFRALAELVDEKWGFEGRRRNPPTDPLNVLLSYGYGVLFNTLYTLVERRGLNAWLGALHTSNGRHPALVSDLMEEFRAPVVDAVALNALLHALKPADFVRSDGDDLPCRLTDGARRRYVQWLQNKFRAAIVHPRAGQRLDHHRLMQAQVYHYARVVLGEEPVYHPVRLK